MSYEVCSKLHKYNGKNKEIYKRITWTIRVLSLYYLIDRNKQISRVEKFSSNRT